MTLKIKAKGSDAKKMIMKGLVKLAKPGKGAEK